MTKQEKELALCNLVSRGVALAEAKATLGLLEKEDEKPKKRKARVNKK